MAERHAPRTSTRAARRRAPGSPSSSCPTFRGDPGWEFTPIDKLDLDAYPAAPGGDARRARSALDARRRPRARSSCRWRRPPSEHPELVERHLGSVVDGDTPFVARNDAHWTDGTLRLRPARRDGRGADRHLHRPRAGRQRAALARCSSCSRRAPRPRSGTSRARADADGARQRRRRARRRPERAPALRRPAGPRGDHVGLRRPSAPPSAATARWTGSRSASARPTARSSRRPSSPAPARTAA